jgi:hypothetical protein
VNGVNAAEIQDELLAKYDLVVLNVEGKVGDACKLGFGSPRPRVECNGFTGFHLEHFWQREVSGKVSDRVPALMADRHSLEYLRIMPKAPGFGKGFSGGPVFEGNTVIGVLRILDASENQRLPKTRLAIGYAIALSPDIVALIKEKLPPILRRSISVGDSAGKPRNLTDTTVDNAPPKGGPVKVPDDPQKGRWGGKSTGFGYRLVVNNFVEYKRDFVFDAILERVDAAKPMLGPVIFHLHDTFDKSVIWIRKTDGHRAILSSIDAIGTFTFGVQFQISPGKWRSLEFDLAKYKKGWLRRYDR